MESILTFIKSEKSKNEMKINDINEKINQCKYQIEEIDNMILELTKNIDTTYEIFSPNDFDKDNNIIEIEKLNLKRNELDIEIDVLKDELKEYKEQKIKIDNSLEDIYDMETQLANNVKNTKYLIEKEVKKNKQKNVIDSTLILEKQINKDSHYITNILKKDIEKVHNKIDLCENLLDIDSNRAKLEIKKIREELTYIEKKVNAKMFHVKHLEEESDKVGLYKSINDFIKEYQKKINMKLVFNYSGMKISDTKCNIINVLRIIKESIDNAENHSNGNIININVVIDKISFEEDKNNNNFENENFIYEATGNNINDINNLKENNNKCIVENVELTDLTINNIRKDIINNIDTNIRNDSKYDMSKNNIEMHQINFVLEDSNRYNVNVIITDNGDGFTIQSDNVLVSNNLNGISIMKYRTELLNGRILVDSSLGMGTTVKLVYQIS